MVEDGYRDLKRLELEQEIATTSSVSITERKLPPDIMKKWAEIVNSDTTPVNRSNKFQELLKFLLHQNKTTFEYESSELRTTDSQSIKGSTHYAGGSESNIYTSQQGKQLPRNKCLFHNKGEHSTCECQYFLFKTPQERLETLKQKNACLSCLKHGHQLKKCRNKKVCGINGCTKLHGISDPKKEEKETQGMSTEEASGTTNMCNKNDKIDTCLLQLQRIQTRKG